MAEMGDKVDSHTRAEVESLMNNLKRAMEGEDTAEIKHSIEALNQASHNLAQSMYQQASQSSAEQAAGDAQGTWAQGSPGTDDEVVDADFREVA